uniref:DNA topoisomerase (ATP-hydrolyzing) n=2 Tax=Rhodosorus marinus TaxID=101924 RepID=A0A7S2ZB09_9RHOD|mmetsp:Transcript_13035/g.51678  ORF Transcript_13035/g.51678 Transcript_13035/m.51678 type:complete len:991 (+) Transcript_13035:1635-4607(+)
MDNAEINALKKILGLQHNKVYDRNTIKTLRYGRVLIMTDQDHDGSHIKGLLVNFFHHFWPSLVKVPGFLAEFLTPIVKCTRKKTELTFFTIPEYVKWRTSLENNTSGWKIKYYKGLGSSTAEEARGYFSNLDRHVLEFHYSGEEDFASIDLAFSKQKVQQRKEWLSAFQEGTYFDHEQGALSYKTFVDKELILFSIADNERSIPGLMDGLKPSQRKVLFSCFKRNLKTEIKVAQLQGYTSEHTAYHHGEASLMATIIGLAQSFCGSNNINFLHPAGQFGTRLQGGKDAASPRYIFTRLSKITRLLFPMEDDAILDYLEDDGVSIEPKYYAPVIPTVLVNGAEGIGTGWSSSVPCYNPRVLIELIRKLLNETPVEDLEEPQPWFRHHRGTVRRTGPNNYEVHGEVRRSSSNKLVITELPAKTWTNPYKEWLESMTTGGGHPADSKEPPFLVDVRDGGTETEVLFTLEVSDAEMAKMEDVGIHKKLRLSSSIATSNLVLFDEKRRLRKYENAREILACFFKLRLEKYEERRLYLLKMLQEAVEILENKVRFIKMVVDGKLKVAKKKKDEIIAELKRLKFKANAEKKTKKGSGDEEEDAADVDEASSGPSESVNYDYLLSMPLWSLTLERVQKLIADRDQKVVEMSNMEKSTAKDIYRFDLDRLSEGLDALDKEDMEQKRATKAARSAATNSKSRGGSKKKTLAVNEDEDVEFAEVVSLPEVKMKAAKRTAKVAVASVNPVGDKRSAPNALPKQRLTKKMVISDSESEPSFQDDSEEEELLADVKPSEPRPKAAPAKAPAAATKPTKTTAPKSAPKPSFFRQAAPVEAAADDSDDELELTLTQRLAKKMMIAERPGPNASSKSATTAKASKPEKQADAKAKRGRKGTAPKVVKSPFGVTPEAKRTKTTAKAKATRLVKVDERSSDADEESFGALSISSDEEHDEKDPTPRKRSTRARKPTTAISEVIDVDDDEDEESGSFADEDSGSDYTDGD